jgi:hypothetical protein
VNAIEAWQDFPSSELSEHEQSCCRTAREWLFGMDRSHMPAGELLSGPRWLRQRVKWGPSRWPLFWCEAVAATTLDCGALAALAKQVFLERGVPSYTAQFIQQYTKRDSIHWYRSWQRAEAPVCWIQNDLVYHEACAVAVGDGDIRIWDPTAGWWVDPRQVIGYSGVLAARILMSPCDLPQHLVWGAHSIIANEWQPLRQMIPESRRASFDDH